MFLVSALLCGAFLSRAEDDVPISLEIYLSSDTKLETAGTVDALTFTLSNGSDEAYTLYNAKLSGGFDGETRALNEMIIVDAYSTREFSLSDISVADDQLDQDIVYILSWDEMIVREIYKPESSEPGTEEDPSLGPDDYEMEIETEEEESVGDEQEDDSEQDFETETDADPIETVTEYIPRSIEAIVRIERFVPPELGISVTTSSPSAAEGDIFSVTYTIINDTKYDMSGIMLTDPGVYDGAIPIPSTELMAGDSITVTIDYTIEDRDMVFHPTVSYVAAQRQYESQPKEPVVVGSVVTAIKIDVEQYPSNVEGSTFAITITNIGNRTLSSLQLYDEINTEIDKPFDLAAQQQKVITFNVPSAYSAGLIRTVRFRVTGYDYFGDPFSYTDVNSYDCIPYITSDEVRFSVLASLRNAYYDDDGKLCGEILLEMRNYSDVRLTNAALLELTLFGTLETYRELLRGETYHTVTYQLEGVSELQFCVTATDSMGQTYTSEITRLSLEPLASLASTPEGQQIVYQSNTFLRDLANKVAGTFRNALFAAFILVMVSTTICLVLWFLEEKLKSRLPVENSIKLVVPKTKTSRTSMDQVLNSSAAEQLGYTVPNKIRYGATTIKTSTNEPSKAKRYSADPIHSTRSVKAGHENGRNQKDQNADRIWSKHTNNPSKDFLTNADRKEKERNASPKEPKPADSMTSVFATAPVIVSKQSDEPASNERMDRDPETTTVIAHLEFNCGYLEKKGETDSDIEKERNNPEFLNSAENKQNESFDPQPDFDEDVEAADTESVSASAVDRSEREYFETAVSPAENLDESLRAEKRTHEASTEHILRYGDLAGDVTGEPEPEQYTSDFQVKDQAPQDEETYFTLADETQQYDTDISACTTSDEPEDTFTQITIEDLRPAEFSVNQDSDSGMEDSKSAPSEKTPANSVRILDEYPRAGKKTQKFDSVVRVKNRSEKQRQ